MRQDRSTRIEQVRIEDVNILNPRVRNQKKFMDMTGNIANVGLKRPITITPSKPKASHGKPYELVCGQGRIEAFLACGQKTIPAIIINATEEQALIMSLVENLGRNRYMLLDGHMRLEALRELGETEVICIVAEDDESFTYNKHVNRLSAIQEHKMILLAVERGVPEEKIAKALNLDVTSIVRRRNLLEGIAPEVAELLKDKLASVGIFPVLRKMKPVRQVEAAMLMCDSGNYSLSYARAMLAATPKDQLVNPDKPKSIKGLTDEQMARMETEMASLQREYRLIEENYGTDVLNLTLAKGYITSLLSNARIVRYLAQHHSQMLGEFQKVAEMKALVTER